MLVSCDYLSLKQDTKTPIASVMDVTLYKEDLKSVIPSEIKGKDSILFVKSYINSWIKQRLLLNKAALNLADDSEKFEYLVKKYREELFINSYKEAVVKQYLDTEVNENDIHDYYLKNSENFKLNEELIQFKFLFIRADNVNKTALIKLFKSGKKEDTEKLLEKEFQLDSYHFNDSIWVKYSDVVRGIPILKNVPKKELVKKSKFIQKEDSLGLYLISVKKVLVRNEIAPKSYITPTVKNMILHQRKLLLLRNIEETLLEDASKKEQFEIY
ncbi:MAG: hypothetical protein COB98_00050 [Flavobacteriaceae bacterium]|nr:MAG: hypothetical protein COB98_00050 [Flavobacteriaceae bacterium]